MTETADRSSGVQRLLDSPFSIGSTVVGVGLILGGLFAFWTGYQESALPILGTELTIITGLVGMMFAIFFGLSALIVAAFMEPGFDQ